MHEGVEGPHLIILEAINTIVCQGRARRCAHISPLSAGLLDFFIFIFFWDEFTGAAAGGLLL